MSYCGPQYASANCSCYLQLTPGISPGSNVATTTPICAFRSEGKQYACDPDCCPAACTIANSSSEPLATTPTKTSTGLTVTDWILIVLAIIFCVLLLAGIVWASRKRKNLNR